MRLFCWTLICVEFIKQSWYLCKAILHKIVNNAEEKLEMSSLNKKKIQFEQSSKVDHQATEKVGMKETCSVSLVVIL